MAVQGSDAPRIRVAAILQTDGRFVLVRHRKGESVYHLLPGGGVEPGERLTEALQREVREETGLDCELGEPLVISDTLAPDGSRHMVQITFSGTVLGGALTQSPDDPRVEGVDLVAESDLPGLDLRPPITAEILDALSSPEGPARYVAARWVEDSGPGEA